MAPLELSQSIGILHEDNENLLVGIKDSDDASVYRLNGSQALIQSLDFITPIVDDPYTFGQIAATNSLSDIFAMNGRVINALNIVGFDSCNLTNEILDEILQGGASKVRECGGLITGGHTIESLEMYYGLSVTGLGEIGKIWRNNTPKVGDLLILTKPLGTGIISTAIKGDMANKEDIKEISNSMTRLNQKSSEVLSSFSVSACTDISGFGLLGHAKEMANENVSLVFEKDNIPFFKNANSLANMGLIPEGSYKNYEYIKSSIVGKEIDMLLCDAQTSGGLLVSIDEKNAKDALRLIRDNGDESANIIGYVEKRDKKALKVI